MIFQRVSRNNPCPVCGKHDWCAIGDYAIKCMRVESRKASRDGGWYHPLDSERKLDYIKIEREENKEPALNAGGLLRSWRTATLEREYYAYAASLGVMVESLLLLRACRMPSADNTWAFAMCDEYGEPIGIRLRSDRGKWSVVGSKNGIFVPESFDKCDSAFFGATISPSFGRVFICEGPTDTAAALSIGLNAVGRPSCNSGGDLIAKHLRYIKARRAVIVADNDVAEKPCPTCRGMQPIIDRCQSCLGLGRVQYSPGIQGAKALQKMLPCKSTIWLPPFKDMRKFVQSGGGKHVIDSMLKDFLWK